MTKTLAAILIAVAVALSSDAPAAGPRDLWIGVVGFGDPFNNYGRPGSTALDSSTILEPVAALVGGKWWFTFEDNYLVKAAFRETVGKVPAQWLPPGTELPSTWQAYHVDRRRVRLRTLGPLDDTNEYYGVVVKTDLNLPRAKESETDGDAQGVAVAGDVRVQFFTDLPESQHAELLQFFAEHLLQAGRATIHRSAERAKGVEMAFPNDADTKLLLSQLASAPLTVYVAKTTTLRGAPIYVIEGFRPLTVKNTVKDNGVLIHTGAAATRDRAGALHLIGAWSYFNDNELGGQSRPLAVLERNGESCWLVGHILEGGVHYVLTKPGQIDPNGFTFTCDIR